MSEEPEKPAGHGIPWVAEVPANPLDRKLWEKSWPLALRWAVPCALVATVITAAYTMA